MRILRYILALFAFLMISITQLCAVESWKCLGISGCNKDKTGRGNSLQALSGKQTNNKLSSETKSILLFFGSLGLGSTSIKITNETHSFKYDLKDSSLDLGYYLNSSLMIGLGVFGMSPDGSVQSQTSNIFWTPKKNNGYSVFTNLGFSIGFIEFLAGYQSTNYSFDEFERTTLGHTTQMTKPVKGQSSMFKAGIGIHF